VKINYVSYFEPFVYGGGGEMVMRSLIENGRRRGHEITISSVRPKQMEYDVAADIDFLADVFNYPGTLKSRGAWLDFPDDFLSQIAFKRPFIHFNNAYVDLCNLGYLPCSGNADASCPHKSLSHIRRNISAKEFSTGCFVQRSLVRELFQRSRLNVFVSPLHHRISYRLLEMTDEVPAFVVKPIIDATSFYNSKRERDIDYLFVGVIGEAKGLAAMRKQFADKDIHFIGKLAPGSKLDFGIHHGHVPYERVPEFMNRAKNFVFLPRWPEPQGRVVIEAALCGCNLITNDHVGATSFPFDISDSSNFQNATEEFWEAIEGL
jgi:glycosyltransferase involved in cell wall biosynthesis